MKLTFEIFIVLWICFLPKLAKFETLSCSDTGGELKDCIDSSFAQDLKKTCPQFDGRILINHAPKGKLDAGHYDEATKGNDNVQECARSCCELNSCNYAFMVNSSCFLLTCNNGTEPCEPVDVTSDIKTQNVSMILVREVISPSTSIRACEVGIDTLCDQNEICKTVHEKSRNGFCQCRDDFIISPNGKCVSPSNIGGETDSEQTTTEAIPSFQSSSTKKTMKLIKVTTKLSTDEPQNEVTIYASTNPPETKENPYSYEWRLISHPTEDTLGTKDYEGTKEGEASPHLHLLGLRQGTYVFQVIIKGTDSYGTANATVNVFPQNRTNLPPIAVINPPEQTVQLPTASVILDAGASSDDVKIVGYSWELIRGPIEYAFNPVKNVNSTTLQVEKLIPGNYTFKLTVADAGNLINSTEANVYVLSAIDYPPTAIAGNNIVIYLPQNEVTLNGNASTDDKKITQWEWKSIGEQTNAVDMTDTHTPMLKLSHLQEGIYQYELKVTDEVGQSSTSTVRVFVKKPSGNPPKSNAGQDQTVTLPKTWTLIDASDSKADTSIVKWTWTQISGPTNATILQANEVKANVTGLTKGDYVFQVEIEDDAKLSSKNTTKVSVVQKTNEPPKANAGGETTITLPASVVYLNGSNSKDDVMITSFKWEREADSIAAGRILGHSDESPILQLTDVVPGKYIFKLTVKDEQGLTSQDVAILIVKEDEKRKNLIEIIVGISIFELKESDLEKILQQLSFLLHDIRLHLDHMRSQLNTENAVLILHGVNENNETVDGRKLTVELRQRLRQDVGLLQFPIVTIDTVLCLDSCSGHGICQDASDSRKCVCDAFWMENFLKRRFGNGERNCDWSKVYVGVVACLLLFMLIALLWSLLFLFRKNLNSLKANFSSKSSSHVNSGVNGSSRSSGKRHHIKKQYTLLDDDEIEMEECKEDDEAEFEDSDGSDSDILFEQNNAKKPNRKNGTSKKYSLPNGSRNGILKPPRRVKT